MSEFCFFTVKLQDFCRQKRKVDHPKLTEYERNLAELEALRKFKNKLVENNAKLQRRLQEKDMVMPYIQVLNSLT